MLLGVEMAKDVNKMSDSELHILVNKINATYEDWDFDKYEQLLEAHTRNARDYNWLEDLCTDHRHFCQYADDWLAWQMG